MDYQANSRMKSSRARERYLKRRRRQQALLVVGGLLCVSCLGILIAVVVGIRSCSVSLNPHSSFLRDAADPRWAREVRAHELKLAPWFIELGNERLYTASDAGLNEPGFDSFSINRLEAFPLDDARPVWQSPVSEIFDDCLLGENRLLGYRLHRADPIRLHLAVYDAGSGDPAWDLDIKGAEDTAIIVDGNVTVAGYRLADGYRLAGYNLETQAKAWGLRLPFDGLLGADFANGQPAELYLHSSGHIIAYKRLNVVGLVASGTGERLREYAASSYILGIALDTANQLCYLLIAGNQTGTYQVLSLPFTGGNPVTVHRFESYPLDEYHPGILAGNMLMAAAGGKLALAYLLPASADGEQARTQLVCFDRAGVAAQVTCEIEGMACDLVALPHMPGEFLLMLNAGVDEETQAYRGRGELWRARMTDGTAWSTARFQRPITGIAPFKEDCLVLLQNGEIYSYIAEANAVKKLRKARYPLLATATSPDGNHIAVYSMTAGYTRSEPGQPMQVIIYE